MNCQILNVENRQLGTLNKFFQELFNIPGLGHSQSKPFHLSWLHFRSNHQLQNKDMFASDAGISDTCCTADYGNEKCETFYQSLSKKAEAWVRTPPLTPFF